MHNILLALLIFFPLLTQSTVAEPAHIILATPISVEGVPNLYLVAPNFYRSAQPTEKGFRAIVQQKGIRTVINLRAFHSDEALTKGLRLRLFDFRMHAWHIEQEDVVGALRALRLSMTIGPTLVHCEHGADRTGLITALYRILYQGWSKDAAIGEMENGSFGFHDVWINIPLYIRMIDIEQLKRDTATATAQ
jgi:protein tyrosine/serine phosphatase